MILVSGCLLGLNCRYDQASKPNQAILEYLKGKAFMPICPEQMGGLTTPRPPCEIVGHDPLRVETEEGLDCTQAFLQGRDEVMKLLDLVTVDYAILKAKSPSCGSDFIYDGSFSQSLVPGQGLMTQALREAGIDVYNENNFKSRD